MKTFAVLLLILAAPLLHATNFCEGAVTSSSTISLAQVFSPASRGQPIYRYHSRPGDRNPSQRYVDLANRGVLLNQTDARLGNRGLLIQGGGLCSPTCGINDIHSILDSLGRDTSEFIRYPEVWMERIIKEAARSFRNLGDPRKGVDIISLGIILQRLAKQFEGVELETSTDRPLDFESLIPAEDERVIISVNMGIRSNGTVALHAMDLLDAVPSRKLVLLADPAEPNSLVWAKAEPAHNNENQASIRIDYSIPELTGLGRDQFTGTVLRTLRIKAPQLNPYPIARKAIQQNLSGKYVHFRFENGDAVRLLRNIKLNGLELTRNTVDSSTSYLEDYSNVLMMKEFKPAKSAEEIKKLVGETITVEWAFAVAKELSSDLMKQKYKVILFRESSEDFPIGALQVRAGRSEYFIPLEFIRGYKIISARGAND